ncbi:transmembrane secretion effector [Mucilaginibacter gracilis]|uniref:Transmembrane secretion effector n=1 Tax=Mucilaginibacter gracilis TaxID=423350 RepID=A0A495J9A6_9SPHI|nr:MFS transporter [Mucilaginibacter gracilis]RKR84639.1 transmembrane secretion effector [Mucilaginibacter gracilis]
MANLGKTDMFKAFRSFNYTLYFWGRSVSQFGTWMQRTAVVWVVYSMTHSTFMLGLTIFAEQFPSFLFSVAGGIAADRYERYQIIRITQILSMIQASLLAVLVMTGHFVIWEILVLSMILGVINAFDVPARQAMIHEVLYEETDLPSALSLTSATASLAKLLGPALSGIVLEKFGAGVCFLLNAASFGAVMVSLMFMKLPAYVPKNIKKKAITELKEGFNYIIKTPTIGLVILMLSIICLLVMPYDTLVPVYAKVIFKGNAATFGYITSFIGIGAVCGTIVLTSLKKDANLKRHLLVSTVILGIGLIAFSQSGNLLIALLFAAIAGFGTVAQGTLSNIIVQSECAPEMRGRVISILIMALFGMLPLGSLLVGFVSQKIGAPNTMLCQGLIGLLVAAVFFRLLRVRVAGNPKLIADETEEEIIEKI